MAARRLWLLGPARVDQSQDTQSKEGESEAGQGDAGELPRFRSRRTVALLGYLAAERRAIARDLLAALFWPDEVPSKARGNLRRELHNLAQILPACWELDRQAVAFVPSAATTVDLYTLLGLEAEERWGEAAELLGGEFLEGTCLRDNLEFENWLLGERERWRARTEAILTHVIEGHMRRGRYTDALRYARRLLQLTPWNEETHTQVMRLLAWTGQRAAALRQYESCKQTLWEELGVRPSEETTALCQRIRAGKLDSPPQLPAFLTEEGARREVVQPLFVARERELARLEEFLKAALAGRGGVVFITGGPGHGKTALLGAFARRAMEEFPNLLVASGNCEAYSGVGDPYLPFRDVMGMLTGDVEARWDAGAITRDHARRLWAALPLVVQALLEHDPRLVDILVPGAALLSRAMAADGAAPWLPSLREHVKRQGTSLQDVEQSHLFQQLTDVLRTVAQEQPLLLILDDMQWADAASIGLLFHLGRRLADAHSRVLIACAYRPEEVALGRAGDRHPLAKPLSELKRTFGDVWVDLGRGEGAEGRSFVDALLDAQPNRLAEGFRDALFHRTEGHPLFTVELLRAMHERGHLLQDEDGRWMVGPTLDWDLLPARVEAVIAERIDRLDPELQELLTVASVEGQVFTAQVVAKTLTIDDRTTLRRLSQELARRHMLVREQEEVQTIRGRLARYRFGHVLFTDYLYERLSAGERRLLHGDVAAALEELYEGQLDEMAVQLARHFHQAGDYGRAFRYFNLAAERAARLYTHDEAVTLYGWAIKLADRISLDVASLAKLHRGRGLAYERLGAFERARADHEATLQIARAAGESQVEWRALLDLGKLWRSRDYDQARDCFEHALALARRTDDPAVLADSLNWMGNWYANDESPKRAGECHQEALNILQDLGDQWELANTLDLLGIASFLAGDLGASTGHYDRAIALFRELDDRPRLASSLTGRAGTVSNLVFLASVPPTVPRDPTLDFHEALRIAREIDSASDEAWVDLSLGILHTVHGQYGRAVKAIQSGLRIASEIGHREYIVGNRFALGILFSELFASDQAREQSKEALVLARDLRAPVLIHLAGGALAGTYLMLDDLESAQACMEIVISSQTPMDALGKRYCWVRRAELALALGDPALALDITDRLIASAPGMSPGRVITYLWKLKAEALAPMGRAEEAASLLRVAMENARATKERFLLWRIHASLGRVHSAMNHHLEAQEEFSTARDLIEELAATIPDEALRDGFLQGACNTFDCG
ncbi:MAG: AAA family ATPase [Anaerolineae bacterium]|nr:AAA family ATPase [Anaerolineae bacterium]